MGRKEMCPNLPPQLLPVPSWQGAEKRLTLRELQRRRERRQSIEDIRNSQLAKHEIKSLRSPRTKVRTHWSEPCLEPKKRMKGIPADADAAKASRQTPRRLQAKLSLRSKRDQSWTPPAAAPPRPKPELPKVARMASKAAAKKAKEESAAVAKAEAAAAAKAEVVKKERQERIEAEVRRDELMKADELGRARKAREATREARRRKQEQGRQDLEQQPLRAAKEAAAALSLSQQRLKAAEGDSGSTSTFTLEYSAYVN